MSGSTTATASAAHTVGVEKLRNIEGFEHIHPMITAVVERHGRHVKICKTSAPVRRLEGLSLGPVSVRVHGSVRCAMTAAAHAIAGTYGAQFVGWAR